MNPNYAVVVTGTSSGLGRAIAQRLGGAGYFVVGVSRRPVAAGDLTLSESVYRHVCANLGDLDAIPNLARQLVSLCAEKRVSLYGLVNNAAIGTDGLLPTMHNSEIEELVRTNLISPILLTKYMCRPMLTRREGRIISISSIVAQTGYRGLSAYGATKAAVEGFTRSLSRDLGPRGITVNSVAPGFLETAMSSSLGEAQIDQIKRRAALSRFPEANEVSAAVEFLLSSDAAAITGTTITVDAGNRA